MKTYFVLQEHLVKLNDEDSNGAMTEALRKYGDYTILINLPTHPFDITEYLNKLEFSEEYPIVLYGSLQFCNAFLRSRHKTIIPGLYYNSSKYHTSSYLPQLINAGIPVLNEHHFYQTWEEIIRQKDRFINHFNNNSLFIRPDSGDKPFAGRVINLNDFPERHVDISQKTMCLISNSQDIKAEFRSVIVNDQVVSISKYMENNEYFCQNLQKSTGDHPRDNQNLIDKNTDIINNINESTVFSSDILQKSTGDHPRDNQKYHPKNTNISNISHNNNDYTQCEYISKQVISMKNKPDNVLICDIALTKSNEYKVIELNSFSASGLYDSDYNSILNAINEQAIEEFTFNT